MGLITSVNYISKAIEIEKKQKQREKERKQLEKIRQSKIKRLVKTSKPIWPTPFDIKTVFIMP